jgi:hypothetical protein
VIPERIIFVSRGITVLCICICLVSCTESETYAHVGLRDGGPVFRAPLCRRQIQYVSLTSIRVTRDVKPGGGGEFLAHTLSSVGVLVKLLSTDQELFSARSAVDPRAQDFLTDVEAD